MVIFAIFLFCYTFMPPVLFNFFVKIMIANFSYRLQSKSPLLSVSFAKIAKKIY